jgi:hypothetical protein
MPAATRWGDHGPAIPTSSQRQLRVAAARAGAAGQRPSGGSAGAENAYAGAVLVAASAFPGGSRPLAGDSSPRGATGDRGCSCAGRGCLSAWGLVAGVGVDVSRSAVLGFLSATNPAAVKLIDAFRSHYSALALYVCDRYPLPGTPLTGAKRGRFT